MTTKSKGKEFWEQHLVALRASGLTSVAYAREHGLSVHSLGWWRRKLMGSSSKRTAATPVQTRSSAFVALKVAEPMMVRSMTVTLAIGSDVRLQMSELPPPAWLAEVGRAMRVAR